MGNAATAPNTRARAAAANGTKAAPAPQSSEKIMVSNLPQDVSEAQIKVSLYLHDDRKIMVLIHIVVL